MHTQYYILTAWFWTVLRYGLPWSTYTLTSAPLDSSLSAEHWGFGHVSTKFWLVREMLQEMLWILKRLTVSWQSALPNGTQICLSVCQEDASPPVTNSNAEETNIIHRHQGRI